MLPFYFHIGASCDCIYILYLKIDRKIVELPFTDYFVFFLEKFIADHISIFLFQKYLVCYTKNN